LTPFFLRPTKEGCVEVRKASLLLGSVSLVVLVAAELALAETVRCAGSAGYECLGTQDDDLIYGTRLGEGLNGSGGDDTMYGRGGYDQMYGDKGRAITESSHPGNDTLYGGRSRDELNGGVGEDTLRGGEGDDVLLDGEFGDDTLYGGLGGDYFHDGTGEDRMYGGAGDDTFWLAQDGSEDYIDCGPGYDRYYPAEASEHISSSCEEVSWAVPAPRPVP
jgi:RTX calcium-binding nonapeptide repeat (4 copies)